MKQLPIILVLLIPVTILSIIGAFYFTPVSETPFTTVELTIIINPSEAGNYFVYFPLYLEGSSEEFLNHIDSGINGSIEIIETDFGMTLNISGCSNISINFARADLENFRINNHERRLDANNHPVLVNKSMESISIQFDYFARVYGYQQNAFGHTVMHWDGIRLIKIGDEILDEDGWQDVPINQ